MEVKNMLIVPKNELKKEIQMDPKLETEGTFSEKTLYLEPEKIGVEEYSQPLVKPYHNNTLQEEK